MEIECKICGINVEKSAPSNCDTCHGRAELQERSYTLSEYRANPKINQRNRYADIEPPSSPLVVGGRNSQLNNEPLEN